MQEIKDKTSIVAKRHGLKKVSLFGSYAKGNATNASDVDIIIDRANITGFKLGQILCEFEESFNKPVDMLCFDCISTAFYDKIKDGVITIYETAEF